MLKRTLTYTDFNGEEQTRDFYFNLSTAELTDMQLGTANGLGEYLQNIIDSRDNRKILDNFKMIIQKSYGVRSADGTAFLKNDESWAMFEGCGAFEVLYLSFFENPELAAEFVNGIVPADLETRARAMSPDNLSARERSEAQMQGHRAPTPAEPKTVRTDQEPPASYPQQMDTYREALVQEPSQTSHINIIPQVPSPGPAQPIQPYGTETSLPQPYIRPPQAKQE